MAKVYVTIRNENIEFEMEVINKEMLRSGIFKVKNPSLDIKENWKYILFTRSVSSGLEMGQLLNAKNFPVSNLYYGYFATAASWKAKSYKESPVMPLTPEVLPSVVAVMHKSFNYLQKQNRNEKVECKKESHHCGKTIVSGSYKPLLLVWYGFVLPDENIPLHSLLTNA